MPGDPERVYASMGNYIFSTRTLLRELHDDAANESSSHDFGRDILPRLAGRARDVRLRFPDQPDSGRADDAVPTGATWAPSTPITKPTWICARSSPALNLYNRQWPLRTASYPDPPAKFTSTTRTGAGRRIDSIVSGGCILSGGVVRNSVLGRGVRVHAGALVEDSVILDNCDIGRARQDPARDPGQERPRPRKTPRSATIWSTTAGFTT